MWLITSRVGDIGSSAWRTALIVKDGTVVKNTIAPSHTDITR